MTAKEVEASRLRGNMRALQKKYFSTRAEVPADKLAIVALAEQNLVLGRHETKLEQTFC